MGILNLFKEKENSTYSLRESTEPLKHVLSENNRVQILNLTQATRHLEIMRDSMSLMRETIYPGTFFSRYHTAKKEAQIVIQLCDGHELGRFAATALIELSDNKTQLFNDFLDRCNLVGKLHFVKDEIIAYQSEIPPESYSYFLELLNRQTDVKDTREYIICSVVFNEGGKSYYYLSDNQMLQCGDYVTVPVGKTNEEMTGRIVKVEVFKGNNTPVPVQKLKHIIDA